MGFKNDHLPNTSEVEGYYINTIKTTFELNLISTTLLYSMKLIQKNIKAKTIDQFKKSFSLITCKLEI